MTEKTAIDQKDGTIDLSSSKDTTKESTKVLMKRSTKELMNGATEESIKDLTNDSTKTKKKKKRKSRTETLATEYSTEFRDTEHLVSKKNEKKKKRISTEKKKTTKKPKEKTPRPEPEHTPEIGSEHNKSDNVESKGKKKKLISRIDMTGEVDQNIRKKKKKKKPKVLKQETSEHHPETATSPALFDKHENDNVVSGEKKAKKEKKTKRPQRPRPEISEIEMPTPTRTKKKISERTNTTSNESFDCFTSSDHTHSKASRGISIETMEEGTHESFDSDDSDEYYSDEDPSWRFSGSTLGSGGVEDRLRRIRDNGRQHREQQEQQHQQAQPLHTIRQHHDNDNNGCREDDYDVYMRDRRGYDEPADDASSLNEDNPYLMKNVPGLEDELPSFRHNTFNLANTSRYSTNCCLVFVGIFFICSTIGVSFLIKKLTTTE